MANIIICTPDSDSATITASSEAVNGEVSRLQTLQPSDKWRTDTDTGEYIEIDLGSALPIQVIFLAKTNLSSTATYRIRGATSQANLTASPGYDSTSTAFSTGGYREPDLFHWISTAQTFQWWRIDLDDGSNPDGFIEAGRLYIVGASSGMWQPDMNIQYEWKLGWEEESKKQRSIGGQIYSQIRNRNRVLDFTLGFQSESALYDNAFIIDRERGISEDILVHIDPASTNRNQDWCVHGLIKELTSINNTEFQLFEKKYQVEELL